MSREYTRQISVLGNIPSFGPISFFDDFESLLKWTKLFGEGDSIFELDPSLAYRDNQSLLMKTRTTASAADDQVGAYVYQYMLPSKIVIQAVHFRALTFATIKNLRFYFIFYDGTYRHTAQILYLPATPVFQYLDSNNNPQNIPDSAHSLSINTWHRIQLKVNLNTNKYDSLIINQHEYYLSNLNYHLIESAIDTHMNCLIDIQTDNAAPCQLNIDDFILYEP